MTGCWIFNAEHLNVVLAGSFFQVGGHTDAVPHGIIGACSEQERTGHATKIKRRGFGVGMLVKVPQLRRMASHCQFYNYKFQEVTFIVI